MKNFSTVLMLVVLAVICTLLTCNLIRVSKEKKDLIGQVGGYINGQKAFVEKRKADSSMIATQTQTILTQSEATRLGLVQLQGDIKILQSQVKQQQRVRIDSVSAPYIPDNFADTSGWKYKYAQGDNSKSIIDSVLANSIVVPKPFYKITKWYSFGGQVLKDSLRFDSLRIYNMTTATVGWKKTGLFNMGREPLVEVQNSNPFFETIWLNNVVIRKNKNLFQKPLFWVLIGAVAGGYGVSKL